MIKNERSEVLDKRLTDLENAFHHRSAWFHFIVDEAMKQGLDVEFARKAIWRCGVFHATTRYPSKSDLHEFSKVFINDVTRPMFEMEETVSNDELVVRFHYCPAVAIWQKLGVSEEMMRKYCDIGMEGDRGIVSYYPDLEMELPKTIAWGDDYCEVIIKRKKSKE